MLETNQSAYYSVKKTDAKKVPVKNTLIQTEKTRTLWPELVYNYDCDLTSYTESLRSFSIEIKVYLEFLRVILSSILRKFIKPHYDRNSKVGRQ